MNQRLQKISGREWVLAAVIVLLVVGFMAGKLWVLPAYDQWSASRALLEARQMEYAKLAGFLEVKNQVDRKYEALQPAVFQADTDQITLSRFLRKVESLSRMPSMTIINAKPQQIEEGAGYRRFPIRLTVSGTLPEVTQFVTTLMAGSDVVAMDGFSLRGVQGGRLVECSLSIQLISLTPLKKTPGTERADAKTEKGGVHG